MTDQEKEAIRYLKKHNEEKLEDFAADAAEDAALINTPGTEAYFKEFRSTLLQWAVDEHRADMQKMEIARERG